MAVNGSNTLPEQEITVTKSGFAKELGVSAPYVSKLVKEGRLDGCFTTDGKKIILKKALEKYSRSLTKAPQKAKVKRKTYDNDDEDDDDDDELVYNTNNRKELRKLLKKAESPMHKIQIESTFWQAKTRRLSFLATERELIPLADAKAAVDAVFTPINTKLDDLPVQLKSHFPEISTEAVAWVRDAIDEIKTGSAGVWNTI